MSSVSKSPPPGWPKTSPSPHASINSPMSTGPSIESRYVEVDAAAVLRVNKGADRHRSQTADTANATTDSGALEIGRWRCGGVYRGLGFPLVPCLIVAPFQL